MLDETEVNPEAASPDSQAPSTASAKEKASPAKARRAATLTHISDI